MWPRLRQRLDGCFHITHLFKRGSLVEEDAPLLQADIQGSSMEIKGFLEAPLLPPERRFAIEEAPLVQGEDVAFAGFPQSPASLESRLRAIEAVADPQGVREIERRIPFQPLAPAVRSLHEGNRGQSELGPGDGLRRRVGRGALALMGQPFHQRPGLIILRVLDVLAALLPGREAAQALAAVVRLAPVAREALVPQPAEE